jgi:hypothetical protein
MVRGPDGGLTFPSRRSLDGDPVQKKKIINIVVEK